MAIVKMQRLRVLALRQDAEQILRLLQRMGCVEITDHTAASETQDIVLKRPDASALAADLRRAARLCLRPLTYEYRKGAFVLQ